jgi:hypothetical protein
MPGAGLFSGGFPKLRSTGKNLKEEPQSSSKPQASFVAEKQPKGEAKPPPLPPRPNFNKGPKIESPIASRKPIAAKLGNKHGDDSKRPPPPVPPRLNTTAKKQPAPSVSAPIKNNDKTPGKINSSFLQQVKLKPIEQQKEAPKQNFNLRNNLTSTAIRKEEASPKVLPKEETILKDGKHSVKQSLKNSLSKENENCKLPEVPKGFTFRKKIYPSGSETGLKLNSPPNNMDEIKKLESQLAEAKLDEDFERCVELKRKLTELKIGLE